MLCFSSILFVLLSAVLSTKASSAGSSNNVENNFNKFMEQFTIDQIGMAQNISFETLDDIKAEHQNDLSVSDSKIIDESISYVRNVIELFRPVAHEIFVDAALNRKYEYYVFDEERSLWHKPDQEFEKILFNGRSRNEQLLKEKITLAWKAMFNGSSQSTLETRGLPFFRIGAISKAVAGLVRSSGSVAARTLTSRIIPQLSIASGALLLVGLYVWGKRSSEGHKGEQDHFRYRMGKKVLTDDLNVYFIWYGNWVNSSKRIETMEYLAGHISESYWYNTMRDYYFQESENSEKVYVNGTMYFKESYFDSYSQGKDLDHVDIIQIIKKQLKGNAPDPNGIYFVFGSADVSETATGENNACGYHTYTSLLAEYPTYYSYIFNPENERKCQIKFPMTMNSPNSDIAIDSMASIFAHELVEVVSDPITSDPSWISLSGYENADLCAWTYGSYEITSVKKLFNSVVGDRIYMLQQNLDITTQKCSTGKRKII